MVAAYGRSAQLDSCTFHQLVDLKGFEEKRVLTLHPPAGQVMSLWVCLLLCASMSDIDWTVEPLL